MNGNNIITVSIHIAIIISFGYCDQIWINVDRTANEGDLFSITTSDTTVCQKSNAVYITGSSYNQVVCRCKGKTVYYSYDTWSRNCRSPELVKYGNIFTSSSPSEIKEGPNLMSWYTFSNLSNCFASSLGSQYRIKKWNGHYFEAFNRANDFTLQIKRCPSSSNRCAYRGYFQWKEQFPNDVMDAYRGNLFLMNIYCPQYEFQFMAFSEGRKSYKIDEHTQPTSTWKPTSFSAWKPESSKKTSLVGYLFLAVVFVVFKIICWGVVCSRYRSGFGGTRRGGTGNWQNPMNEPSINQGETNHVNYQLHQTQPGYADLPLSYTDSSIQGVGAFDGKQHGARSAIVVQPSIRSLDQLDHVIAYSDTKPIISDK